MKSLYMLKAKRSLPEEEDPWDPWFDKYFGFVIRAETEQQARKIASDHHADEGPEPWLDPSKSTCEVLSTEGSTGIVISDFAAA